MQQICLVKFHLNIHFDNTTNAVYKVFCWVSVTVQKLTSIGMIETPTVPILVLVVHCETCQSNLYRQRCVTDLGHLDFVISGLGKTQPLAFSLIPFLFVDWSLVQCCAKAYNAPTWSEFVTLSCVSAWTALHSLTCDYMMPNRNEYQILYFSWASAIPEAVSAHSI